MKTRLCFSIPLLLLVVASFPAFSQTLPLIHVASDFDRPVFGTFAPGDSDRLFIVESHTGSIEILDLSDGSIQATPFLTVTNLAVSGEQGLLGLAFHPDYASNGRLFVNYTDSTGATVVEEYQRQTPNTANPIGIPVLSFDREFTIHNGGWMGFGPDGFLYISSGDGGLGSIANDKDSLLGKMLRIDVDSDDFPDDSERNYGIPTLNPYVGTDGTDEVFAIGLRNPWRCSFDRQTGDLYIGDVGESNREEIDIIPAGHTGELDFGWDTREGTLGGPKGSLIDPVYEYGRPPGNFNGVSVTGGYVYRGPNPYFQGKYFFIDWITNRLWSFDFDGTTDPQDFDGTNYTNLTDWTDSIRSDSFISLTSSFAEDEAGNLYLIGLEGGVLKLAMPDSQVAELLQVNHGVQVSGGLGEITDSDNQDLSAIRNPADIASRITVTIETTMPDAFPLMMDLKYEGSVFTRRNVTQITEFFNYQTDTWETVDSRLANRFQDRVDIISPAGDLARFVEFSTRKARARIRLVGNTGRSKFAANIDQIEWLIIP